MSRTTIVITLIALVAAPAFAQSTTTSNKSLAATLNVYAFPQKGQDSSVQSQDEASCYNWAVQNTGSDPFQLQKQAQQQAQATQQAAQQAATQSTAGTTAGTALKGAAVGTLIGGISGNEGKGAAYGAAAGIIAGNRRGRQQQAAASQSVQQQGQQMQQATAEQIDNFKKAFSVCLEGKGYMVKY